VIARPSPTHCDLQRLFARAGPVLASSGDGASQSFAGASLSDSRTQALARWHFQLVNLQVSQRSAAVAAQQLVGQPDGAGHAQRRRADRPLHRHAARPQSDGWQRFYSGALTYEQPARVRRAALRFTLLATVNSQQLERRAAGDIDAPLERITESLEARLDYSIGRLDTPAAARLARVDGRTVAGAHPRAPSAASDPPRRPS
jgi:hypothetical protein